MLDRWIATTVREYETDPERARAKFTLACDHDVWAHPSCTDVTCGICDLETAVALDRWRTVAEIRLSHKPDVASALVPVREKLIHALALVLSLAAALSVLA